MYCSIEQRPLNSRILAWINLICPRLKLATSYTEMIANGFSYQMFLVQRLGSCLHVIDFVWKSLLSYTASLV